MQNASVITTKLNSVKKPKHSMSYKPSSCGKKNVQRKFKLHCIWIFRLLPRVSTHLRLYRSPKKTMLSIHGTDNVTKASESKVEAAFERASTFVRKIVGTDSVDLSIEKALMKSAAICP